MLASSFHSDSVARCRQIITQFFLNDPRATIVPITENEGFSGALVYRVTTVAKCYALRRWPAEGPPPERLVGLHRLLELTWNAGITQVAVPLRSRDGSTLVKADGYLWQVEPWMPGVADFEAQPTRPRLRDAMLVLSRWHAAARTFIPKPAEQAWFATATAAPSPGVQERHQAIWNYQQLAQQGGIQTLSSPLANYPDLGLRTQLMAIWKHFQMLAPAIARALLQFGSTPVPLQPSLRDLWHDHLLFTGNQLTGLIDLSACRSENVTTDLARLLGSLVADNRSEWNYAVDCYQESRPLSISEIRLLRLFDISGVVLSGMTWVDWLVIQSRPVSNRERVAQRLKGIIHRLEHLADSSLDT